jgi:dihydroorotase
LTTTVFKGGRIIDQLGERSGDIEVDDTSGLITRVGPDLTAERVIDVSGCVVSPGFVDLHVHLRQPGGEAAETIESGSRGAARGGFTGVVAMPNTDPCMDSAAVINDVLALSRSALCEVKPSAAISIGRAGDALSPMGELAHLGLPTTARVCRTTTSCAAPSSTPVVSARTTACNLFLPSIVRCRP